MKQMKSELDRIRKLKKNIRKELLGRHSPAGYVYLQQQKAAKAAKAKKRTRTTATMQQLRNAGLTERDIKRLQGKK